MRSEILLGSEQFVNRLKEDARGVLECDGVTHAPTTRVAPNVTRDDRGIIG